MGNGKIKNTLHYLHYTMILLIFYLFLFFPFLSNGEMFPTLGSNVIVEAPPRATVEEAKRLIPPIYDFWISEITPSSYYNISFTDCIRNSTVNITKGYNSHYEYVFLNQQN